MTMILASRRSAAGTAISFRQVARRTLELAAEPPGAGASA